MFVSAAVIVCRWYAVFGLSRVCGPQVWAWSGGQWGKIGDVMNAIDKPAAGGSAPRPGGKGKDYNFDVDFNGRKLVISMNRNDNIFETVSSELSHSDA